MTKFGYQFYNLINIFPLKIFYTQINKWENEVIVYFMYIIPNRQFKINSN